jgi:hypothetical protein
MSLGQQSERHMQTTGNKADARPVASERVANVANLANLANLATGRC